MLSIIVFVVILSVLVMIHEFGHFIMAKRAGIGVEEFGFGLPPRVWGKKIRGTIYSINWLPFGGFVRLVGEDPTDKKRDQKNSFYVKKLRDRIAVVVAGVAMNFVLAVVLFYMVLFALGFRVSLPLIFDHQFKFVNQSKQVLVVDVTSGSTAQTAGIKSGDSIIEAAGKKVSDSGELQEIVKQNDGKELVLTLENPANNKTRKVVVVPLMNKAIGRSVIGVGLGELVVLNYQTLPQKIFAGFSHSYNTVSYSFDVFARLIGFAVVSKDITPVSEGLSGPVGIAQITSQAVALGPVSVLQLMGLLSLNLAIVNILPIPALDGGRFFFLIFEAVTRKKVYPRVEKWTHTIGFALLLGLIVLITYNDIIKLLH